MPSLRNDIRRFTRTVCAIACHASYVYSHSRRLFAQAANRETGAAKEESPGWRPGGFFAVLSGSSSAQVVAARPRIREEGGEGAPVNHVSAGLGALAVADCDHTVEIGGHFHAAAVVLAPAGLPPDRARQVDHGLLHSMCELS